MSSPDAARRALGKLSFAGVDITEDMRRYLLTLSYTDSEEDESDDLQITLQDREGIWLTSWLGQMLNASLETTTTATAEADYPTVRFGSQGDTVKTMQTYLLALGESLPLYGADGYFGSETQAAVKSFQKKHGLTVDGICGPNTWAKIMELTATETAETSGDFSIHAAILRENWNGGGKDKVLDCGTFQLDSITTSGPPSVITIKAAALSFTSQIRQTKISRAWENYTLSGIAAEMAKKNGMETMFLADSDPVYARVEQYRESNISFLSTLCHRAGLSLKVTASMLVLFDPARYEAASPALTIARGGGAYTKYKLNIGKADAEYSDCCVSYVDPATGKKIYGTATAEDYNASSKSNQTLNIYAKVGSVAEAQTLAAKMLRRHNQQEQTASFTMPGNTDLVAGVTVKLTGWGLFDGKWIIKQAKHDLSGSGYTTTVTLRKCLEG